MKPGFLSSECWMAAWWALMSATLVSSVLSLPLAAWPLALIAMPAVCIVVYFAGLHCHNYGENRFRLKAQGNAISSQKSPVGPGRIGFQTPVGDNDD